MNVNVHTPDQKLKPMHTCTRLQAWARLGVGWVHWDALAQPQSRRNQTRVKTVGYHLNKSNVTEQSCTCMTDLRTSSPLYRYIHVPVQQSASCSQLSRAQFINELMMLDMVSPVT